jgi:5-formyltetrahydrofolate cyclo-ligase
MTPSLASPSYDATVASAKWERRRELREARRAIAERRDLEADARSLTAFALDLLATLGVEPPATVLLYESLAVEPPTAMVTNALQQRGFRVLMPITEPDFDLDWFDAADPDRTPLGRDAVSEAAVALVPGLAVDGHATRMGQGGGCYDRVLPRLGAEVPRVVLLHPGESHEAPLPRDPHDVPVTHVLDADGWRALREPLASA